MYTAIALLLLIFITVVACALFYVWLLDYMHRIMNIADRMLDRLIERIEEDRRKKQDFILLEHTLYELS